MSDHEEDRPLTRRERRVREFGETGAMPVVSPEVVREATSPESNTDGDDIVISPVDDDGRIRTRREIRQLQEQALAERAAAAATATAAEESTDAVASEEIIADAVAEADLEVDLEADAGEAPLRDQDPLQAEEEVFDPSLVATQAFTIQDLAEVTSDSDDEGALEAETLEQADLSAVFGGEATAAGQSEDASEVIDEQEERVEVEVDEPVSASSVSKQGYSFPNIAPLEEGISVFDDPAVRTAPASRTNDSGFDDLISRAVAQEGASSAANTSALILPSMPEGADLAGPLGETGELYITGSIELPRSLGETGGHAGLLDSVEADPLDEMGFDEHSVRDDSIAPVSAARAVSARVAQGPVVAEAHKEKSKLPVVLIATGGGLVVAVGALLIWGATSGMFG